MIEAHRDEGSISRSCQALGVSYSGYCAWRKRLPSQRKLSDERLLEKIRRLQTQGRGLYGSPRIYQALQQQGEQGSRKRVARLMRENGLNSRRRPKRRIRTTDSQHNHPIAANLLARAFHADQPNQKWVGDIVGVWTGEGWLYLAALLDIFSRRIIGWAMGPYRDEQLTIDALCMALDYRILNPDQPPLHHTDRGSQYTAKHYQQLLADYGIQVSMSGKGDPYDNAIMESFFSTLRAELTDLYDFPTRNEARLALFDYLELFYNRLRIHSAIGYISPIDFEAKHHL